MPVWTSARCFLGPAKTRPRGNESATRRNRACQGVGHLRATGGGASQCAGLCGVPGPDPSRTGRDAGGKRQDGRVRGEPSQGAGPAILPRATIPRYRLLPVFLGHGPPQAGGRAGAIAASCPRPAPSWTPRPRCLTSWPRRRRSSAPSAALGINYFGLSWLLRQMGDNEAAAAAFRKAEQFRPPPPPR